MKRVTNCILRDQDRILMLKKPSRGWWVAPGGKMEPGETITESMVREYREETGLYLLNPQLKGVFTIMVESGGQIEEEWMMFTFLADSYTGRLLKESPEGELEWIPVEDVKKLPTAKGDQYFLTPIAQGSDMLVGRFHYTSDYELLSVQMDRALDGPKMAPGV
ncbi:MAG: 8-oxo-dGTP diphosphatase [Bacillaceae bacterium]|nr:8-oxo-dGTP diphosphatase [Bacillaceae bacterium]